MSAESERYPDPTAKKALDRVARAERSAQSFTVPGRLAGMNEYQRECRAHWSRGWRMKKEQQGRIELTIKQARLRPYTRPVKILIRWVEPNRRRDLDNITAASKWVLDALVNKGVIPGDGDRWVKAIKHERGLDKNNPRVEVEIREV